MKIGIFKKNGFTFSFSNGFRIYFDFSPPAPRKKDCRYKSRSSNREASGLLSRKIPFSKVNDKELKDSEEFGTFSKIVCI